MSEALTNEQLIAVYDAVVAELLERYDDPYSGDPVISEQQARLIAGAIRDRLVGKGA